ncbi:taxadien-5-alpha-ol O-acetyltransferase-like [Panicum miliaceum]|uniref:Taxadien-5-alpha-ol O-acetyltransferase-like n=1 Tax=Panicum miliaceum TaxID=4540 RepID=A0A3L6S0M5_PANMI|nr:taxadien-5-alpha-ol O-acetyltransferase-like [Panicum miliaceum]
MGTLRPEDTISLFIQVLLKQGCECGRGAMWTIWKVRNDLIFNDKVLPAPEVTIYKMVSLLAHWQQLLSEKNRRQVEVMIDAIRQAGGWA